MEQFEQDLEGNLGLLQSQLEKEEYTPLPVLRIYIDREDDTRRPIGIPAIAESVGFDPFIGFLHGLRYGRQSLALDLMEEFRHPVIDGLVLSMINKRSIKEWDFHQESNGAFFLNKEAFSKFLALYEEQMEGKMEAKTMTFGLPELDKTRKKHQNLRYAEEVIGNRLSQLRLPKLGKRGGEERRPDL